MLVGFGTTQYYRMISTTLAQELFFVGTPADMATWPRSLAFTPVARVRFHELGGIICMCKMKIDRFSYGCG